MTKYTLLIKPNTPEVADYYHNKSTFHVGDAGFDLYVPQTIECPMNKTTKVSMQVKCEMIDENGANVSYFMYARSSISKTPLIVHNSVGIFDAGYRGDVIAALRCLPNGDGDFLLEKDTRVVQICAPNLGSFEVKIVDELSETSRGEGGFGSTGR